MYKRQILYCPVCDHPQSQINFTNCEKCGHDLGAPNVNIVSTENELKALKKRYDDAKNYTIKNGTEDTLNKFENYFDSNAKAIINISFQTLYAWIVNTGAYQSYHRSVEVGLRNIADLDNDRKRSTIDSFFYGTHGRDITYAALTLNNEGLESYGNCRIILNDDSIKSRASTLEENSFDFVKTHKVNLELLNIPAGYRSTWFDKLKLAVSKLHTKLSSGNNEGDFDRIILSSNGDRKNDQFIEVHIYKKLTTFAVESIFIPTPKNNKDKLLVKAIEGKCPGKINIY